MSQGINKRDAVMKHSSAFLPKAQKFLCWQVFWLALLSEAFPFRRIETVALKFPKALNELTAAGTAPELNGIPF